jgi:2-dehydropantoate 2-reductase
MNYSSPKILIIGTGAIGGLYGAKLASAGAEVSTVCRSDYKEVKSGGISIESHWGNFHFTPKQVFREAKEYQGEADFILVATKVLPEISITDLIAPALSSNTSIILLQNGIHIERSIAKAFPRHHLISVIAFVCVSKKSAGTIYHQDLGRIILGDYPSGISDKTKNLAKLWRKAGVACQLSENIQEERWKKLVWNAPFNSISVLACGATTDKILANPFTEELAKNVMREVCVLAEADGFKLPKDIIKKILK